MTDNWQHDPPLLMPEPPRLHTPPAEPSQEERLAFLPKPLKQATPRLSTFEEDLPPSDAEKTEVNELPATPLDGSIKSKSNSFAQAELAATPVSGTIKEKGPTIDQVEATFLPRPATASPLPSEILQEKLDAQIAQRIITQDIESTFLPPPPIVSPLPSELAQIPTETARLQSPEKAFMPASPIRVKTASPAPLTDAALMSQPPFLHSPHLQPGLHPQAPPIDPQLPHQAPSLVIETVLEPPNMREKRPSFWQRRKKGLIIFIVLVMVGMSIGLVFIAHSFYRRWGGQGFLKKRGEIDNKDLFLNVNNLDVLAHQVAEKPKGKSHLEDMLLNGYKGHKGYYRREAQKVAIDTGEKPGGPPAKPNMPQPAKPNMQGKQRRQVEVIPVGTDAGNGAPLEDSDLDSDYWHTLYGGMNDRPGNLPGNPSFRDAVDYTKSFVNRYVPRFANLFDSQIKITSKTGTEGEMTPQEAAMGLADTYVTSGHDSASQEQVSDGEEELFLEDLANAAVKAYKDNALICLGRGLRIHNLSPAQKAGGLAIQEAAVLLSDFYVINSGPMNVDSQRVPASAGPSQMSNFDDTSASNSEPQQEMSPEKLASLAVKAYKDNALLYLGRGLRIHYLSPSQVKEDKIAIQEAAILLSTFYVGNSVPMDVDSQPSPASAGPFQISSTDSTSATNDESQQDLSSEEAAEMSVEAYINNAFVAAGKGRKINRLTQMMPNSEPTVQDAAVLNAQMYATNAGPADVEVAPKSPKPAGTKPSIVIQIRAVVEEEFAPEELAELSVKAYKDNALLCLGRGLKIHYLSPSQVEKDKIAIQEAAMLLSTFYVGNSGPMNVDSQPVSAKPSSAPESDSGQDSQEELTPAEIAKVSVEVYIANSFEAAGRSRRPFRLTQMMPDREPTIQDAAVLNAKVYISSGPVDVSKIRAEEQAILNNAENAPQDTAKMLAQDYVKTFPVKMAAKKWPDVAKKSDASSVLNALSMAIAKAKGWATANQNGGMKKGSKRDELKERGKAVPYSPCGDQRRGCEAFEHPEICCPVGHICRESPTTNSGFICCKGDDKCETPVQAGCPPGTGPCTVEVGGGCCAPEDGCSPNGCLKFEPGHGPDDKNARAVTEIRVNPEDLPPAANEELDKVGVTDVRDLTGALTITPSNLPPAASKVLEDIGITEVKGGEIRVTATAIKEGEVQIDIGIGEDGVTGSVKKSSAEKAIAEWWTLEGDKTGLAVVLLLLVAGGMMFL